LKTLAREGEGPGEVRRPADMLFMPDGTLGLVQFFPGKIIQIHMDGTPAGSLIPESDASSGGGFQVLRRVAVRGGNFVLNGSRMSPSNEGMQRSLYIASCTLEGVEEVRYVERSMVSNIAERGEWIEKDDYFPDGNRWALGPDGRVYIATVRDSYAISVYRPDGELERIIECEHNPWQRTEEEKQFVAEGVVIIVNNERLDIDAKVEDHAPAVTAMHVAQDGSLWVLNSRSVHEQPTGIMQTYDIFDSQGHWQRQVAIACPGDAVQDRLYFTGSDRAVLVKGAVEAQRNMFGGSGDSDSDSDAGLDEEPAPLEVVVYSYSES